jgi:diaminopimelate decarboxylase
MVASNLLDEHFFVQTAKMLFEFVIDIERKTSVRIEFVNLGGGFGVAYKPVQKELDLRKIGAMVAEEYERTIAKSNSAGLKIFTESGRFIAAEAGVLITKVIHRKDTYKRYAGVDACMANLMRPGMYGAYHHITVLGKEHNTDNNSAGETVDIIGSLCENCDKFAVDRLLPKIEIGDLLAIHDAGAHGYAMGFQYNGKLRCAELLLRENGSIDSSSVDLIRRAETVDDYFATLNFS